MKREMDAFRVYDRQNNAYVGGRLDEIAAVVMAYSLNTGRCATKPTLQGMPAVRL